jgi:hypothetical protein
LNAEDLSGILRLQEQYADQVDAGEDNDTDSPSALSDAPGLIIHELYRRINNRFKSYLQRVREEWKRENIRQHEDAYSVSDIEARKQYFKGQQPLSDLLEMLVNRGDFDEGDGEDGITNCETLTSEVPDDLSVEDARLKYMRYLKISRFKH